MTSDSGMQGARAAKPEIPTQDQQERIFYPVRGASWVQSFFEVSPETASKLESAAIKRTFRRAETILQREERSDRLFMIARGQVKMLLGGKGRDDLLVAVLGEGEYFGACCSGARTFRAVDE